MTQIHAGRTPAPVAGATCQALDAHFDIHCGAPATVTAFKGERSGYLCSDDANRAVQHGWVIGPSVSDVRSFIRGGDEDVR
jgi:hypothetical protein